MIPPHFGAGHRVALQRLGAPVNIAKNGDRSSAVVHGAGLDTPIGPKVLLGVAARKPGEDQTWCYLAHLEPNEAIVLAGALLEAAATIAEFQQRKVKQ